MTSGKNQIAFFATQADLLPGIRRVEQSSPLEYAVADVYSEDRATSFHSLTLVPGFGVSESGDAARGVALLVVPAGEAFSMEKVSLRRGGVNYHLSQVGNPKSIVFRWGGTFGQDCLVAGAIGTASFDPASVALFKRFSHELTRGFSRVRMWLVGPEALGMMRKGHRLVTMGANEAPEYDLRD